MMNCIETKDLTHHFSEKEIALNNISIQVPEGSIYGFLGPNGAGKTTTLRLILGLLKKQSGSISIFGKVFSGHRVEILQKTGSLIESPSLYGHLTAFDNLLLLQKIYQCPKERIQEVLDLVGLPNTGKKKASQFSLGMKQRLSIAIALLHKPSLLILDEPTNGLDPNGIIEIRELLKKLNREEGITIIISSHLLSEIEKLVTHVGIINKGNIVFQGTLDDLVNKQHQSSFTRIGTSDAERTLTVLNELSINSHIENGKNIIPVISNAGIAQLNQKLVAQKIDVFEITTMNKDLEAIFMDLINNQAI